MRSVDETGLSLQTQYANGKIRATVIDNRDKEERAKKPLGAMKLIIASSSNPDAKEALLEQTSAGVYEAIVDADASGSYTITVSGAGAVGKENKPVILARAALAIPYSPEFAAVKSNEGLLEEIAQRTGGRVLDEASLARADIFSHEQLPIARLPQPLWHWLLYIAAVVLFLDVATRRLAVDPVAVAGKVQAAWQRWRGRGSANQDDIYLERLKSRKAAVGEQLDRGRPTQRYEPPPQPLPPRPTEPTPAAESPRPATAQPTESPAAASTPPDDFAARLMKAKQKARDQIEGEKGDGV